MSASPLPQRSVSVILPVHQQADHIESILESFYEVLEGLSPDLELIVVVNASTDRSAEICRSIAGRRAGLLVIERAEAGWGGAVRAGLGCATGDVLCFTNSARTTATDLRTAVVLGLLNEGRATKAVRRNRDSLRRRAGSVLYNLEARALFGLASWDLNGTPKVFPREFGQLLQLQEDGDLLDLEWLATCDRAGYPLIEFPVTSVRRHGGRSTTRWSSALRMYSGAILLRRRLGGADRSAGGLRSAEPAVR